MASLVPLALAAMHAPPAMAVPGLTAGPAKTVDLPCLTQGNSYDSLTLQGGAFGAGTCAPPYGLYVHSATFESGMLAGGTYYFQSAVSLTGPVVVRYPGTQPAIVNQGSWTQTGHGALDLQYNAYVVNQGPAAIYRITGSGGIGASSVSLDHQAPYFANQGGALLQKLSDPTGTYTTSFINVPVVNQGSSVPFGPVLSSRISVIGGMLVLGAGGLHETAVLEADGGTLVLQGAHSIAGAVEVKGSSSVMATALTVQQGANLSLNGSLEVRDWAGGAGYSLVNKGIVNAAGAGRITVSADNALTNTAGATMSAPLSLQQGAVFDNAGVATVSFGPNASTWAGATLHNSGTLNLDGFMVSDAATGIRNSGQVQVGGNLFHDGAFVNDGSGHVQVTGTWNTSAAMNGLSTAPSTATISNSGVFEIASNPAPPFAAVVQVAEFTQDAGRLTVDGELDTNPGVTTRLTGGVLNGTGRINGDVFIGGGPNAASFQPGHSPGTFQINGALTMGGNSELDIDVQRGADGLLRTDLVRATGGISFLTGSTIRFLVGPGVLTANGQYLGGFMDCGTSICDAGQATVVIDGAPGAYASWGSDGGLNLGLPAVQAVPEPATAPLWLAGGLVMLFGGPARRHLLRGAVRCWPAR